MLGQLVPVTGIGTAVEESVAVLEVLVGVGVDLDVDVAVDVFVGVGVGVGVAVDANAAKGFAEAVAVEVASGISVGSAVGLGDAHSVKSEVQEAPKDGQQYSVDPQKAVVPTLAIVEQLNSSGASPVPAE